MIHLSKIEITVKDKIATTTTDVDYICGNKGFVVEFAFDEEWKGYNTKTARFIYGSKYQDVVFEGNTCKVPVISNTLCIQVGVFAGDLQTTTAACVNAKKSILCNSGAPEPPSDNVYNQIMGLLNKDEDDSDSDVFVVKITLNEEDQSQNTMDRTFEELSAARLENKVIEAELWGARYPLAYTEGMGNGITNFVFGLMSSVPGDPLLVNSRVIHINVNGIECIWDEVYIPDDEGVLRYTEQELTEEEQAQARKNIGAASVDDLGEGGGANADWSVNDPDAEGYVKNRTHWLEPSPVIEFDGNTEGRESFDASAAGLGVFYKVSDQVWTKEQCLEIQTKTGLPVFHKGVLYDENIGLVFSVSSGLAYIMSAFTAADLTSTLGFSIPSAGMYMFSTANVTDMYLKTFDTYHKIGYEYLPDDILSYNNSSLFPSAYHDNYDPSLTLDGDAYDASNVFGESEEVDARIEKAIALGMAGLTVNISSTGYPEETIYCRFILTKNNNTGTHFGTCVSQYNGGKILVCLEFAKQGVSDATKNVFQVWAETIVTKSQVQSMIDEAIAKISS